MRNGIDAAKAIALGANAAGVAKAFLEPAIKDKKSTFFEIEAFIKEIRAAMFLIGAEDVSKLSEAEVEIWM